MPDFVSFIKKIYPEIKIHLQDYAKLAITLLVILIFIRVFEFFYTGSGNILFSLWYDVTFIDFISFVPGIIFIILSFISKKAAAVFYYTFAVIISAGYILLIVYFSKAAVPLGSDLFGYNLTEITKTAGAALKGMGIFLFIGLFLFSALIVTVLHFSRKIVLNKITVNITVIIIAAGFLFAHNFYPQASDFKSESDYYKSVNKLQFFYSKTTAYFFPEEEFVIPAGVFYNDGAEDSLAFKYINPDYPFLHEEKTPDVLSSFFNISKEKPNIIFILVESLGRGYSGKNALFGSFTPFLDSLAESSLYWENFISTGGRTFAALPSIFGSLPFARQGFLELKDAMPEHFSLFSFLRNEGYKTGFFHGSDASFDYMSTFLKKNNVDILLDESNFGTGYKKMPSSGSGFSWGYGDKELFQRSLQLIPEDSKISKFMVYLTLSMHSPFLVENQDYYINKYYETIKKQNIGSEFAANLDQYKDILATVLYTDDAIKSFIENYKKRQDFKNTIFIITGDHRMPEIPIVTQIDRFHVPFLIYSPMLKRHARFSSVSSHFDFTPTILAFLKSAYNMNTPAVSVFMGSYIDTARQFRNVHSYPLMRNKNELIDYIDGRFILSDNVLYSLESNMGMIRVNDDSEKNKIERLFSSFKEKNEYMVRNKKLQP